MRRYSKNRAAVLDCLRGTKSHPAAEWIYAQLKPAQPALSLATVYRNLAILKADGEIRSVGVIAGQERFDATVAPHPHAVCTDCGAVIDVPELSVPQELISAAQQATGCLILQAELQFEGLCPRCAEK